MARGITEQDVLEAADALLTRGERPTIERVRQEIGSGSPNTVNRHLDTWWASLANRIRGKNSAALPASLLELCQRLYEGVKTQAVDEAKAIAAASEQSQKEDRANVERMVQAVESEKTAIAATVEKLREDLRVLGIRNEMLVADRARLTSELDAARRKDEDQSRRVAGLVAELEKATASHKAEAAKIREQWQGNETRWLKEIEHLREDAKRQRADSETRVKVLGQKVAGLEKSLALAERERIVLLSDLEKRDAQLGKERETRIAAESTLGTTKALVKQLLKSNSQARRRSEKTPATARRPAGPGRTKAAVPVV